ncbi:hypothetical protein IG631_13116 [Alternaria alternata]|nr:hypothetical protein IG631_13116 [Alternaria alternata]
MTSPRTAASLPNETFASPLVSSYPAGLSWVSDEYGRVLRRRPAATSFGAPIQQSTERPSSPQQLRSVSQ